MNADKNPKQNRILHGISISPGFAIGSAFIYKDILRRNYVLYDIEAQQVEEEQQRIKQAFEEVRRDLQLSAERVEKELESDLADVFRAQETILSDPQLTQEILQGVEQELVNAEQVTRYVFRRWERKFQEMEDAVLRQRSDDIADLSRRMLRSLQGIHAHALEHIPPGSVLVAVRLLPSDTVFLSKQSTVAAVVECGGPGSHAALLTRALGIPAVGQIPDILNNIQQEELLLVNGTESTVICSPDADTLAEFENKVEQYQTHLRESRKRCHEPATTLDGVTISVMANVTCREDVECAVECGADGIGLYRIESFYLSRKILPSEQEVLEEMMQTLMPAKELPVTVRLLDVGGDKQLPFLDLPKEENPFLGRRGIRLLLEYPDLFATQVKAMLRLSREYDLRVLVPMVTLTEDMKHVHQKFHTLGTENGVETPPPLGAMIETPSAALCAGELLVYSDFLSIGTNDLTQYTMAAGRENAFVSYYFQDTHPVIFKLLEMIVAQAENVPLSLCGELAGNLEALEHLLRIGVKSLSVAPPLVPLIKEAIRNIRCNP